MNLLEKSITKKEDKEFEMEDFPVLNILEGVQKNKGKIKNKN